MNRKSILAFGVSLFGALALHAQTTSSQPAPATPPQPALVSDVTVSGNDSPLVRAAKAAAAARKRDASRRTGVVINDAYLKAHPGAKISEARENANTPPPAKPHVKTEAEYQTVGPKPKVADPAAAAKKQEAQRSELERLAAAVEDPTGGDNMDQEQAERRLAQTAREMQQNQQQTDQQTKSVPPPEYRKP
jgi:hypothetical protein